MTLVNHSAAFSGIGVAEEQPVLFSTCCGTDRVFNEIVIDFDQGILEINFKRGLLARCIADGFTRAALRQEASSFVPPFEYSEYSPADDATLTAYLLR